MHWSLATPFEGDWLAPFTEQYGLKLNVVSRNAKEQNWHQRTSAVSSKDEWRQYWEQSGRTVQSVKRNDDQGVITVLPQLATTMATRKRLRGFSGPLVAWFFNTTITPGLRQRLTKPLLSNVDRFVVHSTTEVNGYASWFGLSPDRFRFAPYQVDYPDVCTDDADDEHPYVFATGSGERDYATFFAAMKRLGYPAKVVAGPRILAGLTPPSNVEILDMPRAEIRANSRRARVNVIPMTTDGLVAGYVTMIETLRLGRAPVVTDRTGTEDYVFHNKTGLLHRPGDVDHLAEHIEAMWTDKNLRSTLDRQAHQFAIDNCTDNAAARNVTNVLREVVR